MLGNKIKQIKHSEHVKLVVGISNNIPCTPEAVRDVLRFSAGGLPTLFILKWLHLPPEIVYHIVMLAYGWCLFSNSNLYELLRRDVPNHILRHQVTDHYFRQTPSAQPWRHR